jgi:hypothetical protein
MRAEAVDTVRVAQAAPEFGDRLPLLRYSPALVLFIAAIADVGRWADPDLWGHIRFGQLVLASGHVPAVNSYSYSVAGYPWHDPEWLAEALLAFFFSHFGIIGLKLFKFGCTAATVSLLALAAAETRASTRIQLLVLTVSGVALIPMMQFRPQLFTFMLLSALMLLLARDTYRSRDGMIWIAPALFALWANTHGGMAAGLAAILLYAAVRGTEDLIRRKSFGNIFRLSSVALASAAATLFNPYGYGNWLAVARAIRNPLTRAMISEWQPLLFNMQVVWHKSPGTAMNYAAVIVLPVGLAICLLMRPRGDDLALLAVSALMAIGAWLSVRNMALTVIATVAPLCRHLHIAIESNRPYERWRTQPRRTANEIMVGALALLVAYQSGLFSRALPVNIAMPQGAVNFLEQHGLEGNVLGDFSWGDYLIWRMARRSKVFIDGRYDFAYPMDVISDYFDFKFDGPRAAAVLKAYPHDFILITPASPVRTLIEHRHDWTLVYGDRDALLYARADSAAARIPGVPLRGSPQPLYFP